MFRRWWIRHRLKKCGCRLCVSHLKMLEEMWAAEKLYAASLKGDPIVMDIDRRENAMRVLQCAAREPNRPQGEGE